MNQFFVFFLRMMFVLILVFPAYSSDSDMDISNEEIQCFGASLFPYASMDVVHEELNNSESTSPSYCVDMASSPAEIDQLYLQKLQNWEEQNFPNSPEIIEELEDITSNKEASPSEKARAYYHLGLIDFGYIREWNDSFCVSAYDAFESAVLEKGDLQTTIKCLYYLGKMDLSGWGNENGPDPDKARNRFLKIDQMSMKNRTLPQPRPMNINLWCLSWYEILILDYKSKQYGQVQDNLTILEWVVEKYGAAVLPDVRALALYARGLIELRSEDYGNARFTFTCIKELKGIGPDIYAYALCQLAQMDLEGYGLGKGEDPVGAYDKLQTVTKLPWISASMRAYALFSLAKMNFKGFRVKKHDFERARANLDEIQDLNRIEKIDQTIFGMALCLTAWIDCEGKGLNKGIPDYASASNLLVQVISLETASSDVKSYAWNLLEILNHRQPDFSGMQDFLFKVNLLENLGLEVQITGSNLSNPDELWSVRSAN